MASTHNGNSVTWQAVAAVLLAIMGFVAGRWVLSVESLKAEVKTNAAKLERTDEAIRRIDVSLAAIAAYIGHPVPAAATDSSASLPNLRR